MKILAIESSGLSLSIAISENSNIVTEYFYNAGKIHSDVLVPLTEKIVKDAKWDLKDIEKFAVSCGPGSFTGIRVAMSVIKTLAQTLNKPVVSVDTLEILKNQLNIKEIKIVPAIDALRNEVYVKEKDKIVIVPVETFVKNLKKYKDKIIIIGNAVTVYNKILSKELGKSSVSLQPNLHFPKASTLALMAEKINGTNFKDVEPVYGRKSWAEEKQK
ncbi:MAG: tRNA (adenosine(37)-N6)-threonylcarbamoyltransferase complex dimerization subunit type 1 TsaB [Endomicrobiaceae bacterium]|nr:tRNA (adenosine(37)-N6)-threonylcarbamoyltransferase complex dimerization subunit type 1 TsaB [Endomicrobiaceae bacterium]